MREIKFRAWIVSSKKMLDWEYFSNHPDRRLSDLQETKDRKIMQFTGLSDKNGKEIYEGDIVKNKIGRREVKIGFSKFNDPDGFDHQFYGVYGIWDDKNESYFTKDDDFEVIGNIYENPELINS